MGLENLALLEHLKIYNKDHECRHLYIRMKNEQLKESSGSFQTSADLASC